MNGGNSIGRISALLLRYLYLLRSSWPRIIEIAYWPTMQMVIWGFVSQHFSSSSPELTAGGILISVVLVWDCLFRSHISYTLSFFGGAMVSEFGKFICFSASSQRIDLSLGLHFNDENLDWNAARCFTCDTFFLESRFLKWVFRLLAFL